MALIDEIREQPASAARFLDRQLSSALAMARSVAEREPAFALIAARGTSDHAAIYAQYAFGLRNRLPVALAAPSMFSLYGAPPDVRRAVVIGLSQSGASPDIVAVIEEGRRQGAPTIAITNEADSALASAADHVLALEAGPERAVAATKTYTGELLAVGSLSAGLAGGTIADRRALSEVPDALASMLALDRAAAGLAGGAGRIDRAVVLGRGYEYANAREWALKLQELAQVMAHPWSGADFEHGPLALLEPGLPVLAMVSADVAGDELARLLGRLEREHDVHPIVISQREELEGPRTLRAPCGLPPWLAPVASIVPAQLFAYHLARGKGLDTERPRAIAKVTRTR